MELRDLIALLEISAGQNDHLVQRLISELKERGAILEDLEALTMRKIVAQQTSACFLIEAARVAGELNGTQQRQSLIGRMYGVQVQ